MDTIEVSGAPRKHTRSTLHVLSTTEVDRALGNTPAVSREVIAHCCLALSGWAQLYGKIRGKIRPADIEPKRSVSTNALLAS